MIDSTIKPGYYRVTEILETYSKMHLIDPEVLGNACVRGTKVDEACRCLMQGIEPFHLEDEYKGYLESFREWQEGKTFIANPGRLYCDELMLTGECDGIYKGETGLVLFDIKTPQSTSRSWALQGAAYVYLVGIAGLKIEKIEFVRIRKEGKSALVDPYEYESNWELFKKALELHKYFYEPKKKRPSTTVIEGPNEISLLMKKNNPGVFSSHEDYSFPKKMEQGKWQGRELF